MPAAAGAIVSVLASLSLLLPVSLLSSVVALSSVKSKTCSIESSTCCQTDIISSCIVSCDHATSILICLFMHASILSAGLSVLQ